ncbi:MAG: 2-dehydropantoate 2-reductase N-terminal domain-containing protein [Actinomycetota bacterium]
MSGRYVIYGAGAIGGVIAGALAMQGEPTAVLARGAHREVLAERGMTLHLANGSHQVPMTVAERPEELDLGVDDVVILAMKTQDTERALGDLAAAAPPAIAVVCAQNGVANERAALRRFARVYGMCVYLPATHLEPGVVEGGGTPYHGVLDVGCYPGGVDETAERVAAALTGANFRSQAQPEVMRFKYAKLRVNTRNALDAMCGRDAFDSDVGRRSAAEALEVYRAAGIPVATREEEADRRGELKTVAVNGRSRSGSSSWQSLARGSGSIESDYLNGEIVLLGRLHGVATPVNEALQLLANDAARRHREPGSVALAEVEELIATLDG